MSVETDTNNSNSITHSTVTYTNNNYFDNNNNSNNNNNTNNINDDNNDNDNVNNVYYTPSVRSSVSSESSIPRVVDTELKYNVNNEPVYPIIHDLSFNDHNINNNIVNNNNNLFLGEEKRYPVRNRELSSKALENIVNNNVFVAIEENINNNNFEPKNIDEALKGKDKEKWLEAMQIEYKALIDNNTWQLIDKNSLDTNTNIISGKWIYKIKKDKLGNIDRYKARWVARGFTQVEGVDYDKTFSPTVSIKTVRIILALAAIKNWKLRHLDIKNAYLYGDLDRQLYMQQPIGFEIDNKVCELKKGIYGLKQAGRQWHNKIKTELEKLGYKQLESDVCLFINNNNNNIINMILIFVDDIIVVYNHDNIINKFITHLQNIFKLRDLGELSWFLGININISKDNKNNIIIKINQNQYIKNMLNKYGFNNKSTKRSRIPIKIKNNNDTNNNNNNNITNNYKFDYNSVTGSLLYAAIATRPDISYAVNYVCRYMSCPENNNFEDVANILRYLKTNDNLGLVYKNNNNNIDLIAYSDADWGSDTTDRKSISGYVIYLGGNLISWSTQKQSIVALSTQHAEYIALSELCKEITWINNLLEEINLKLDKPTLVRCDNAAAIAIAENNTNKYHKRTKHIDIKFHNVKDLYRDKKIEFEWISTKSMIADIFTKPVIYNQFKILRDNFMHNII